MQITVVLHNIRSTYNVGAILRTCEGLGIAKVVYSGYTPRFNDMDLLPHLREKLNRQIAKSALGAEELVPQMYLEKTDDSVSGSILASMPVATSDSILTPAKVSTSSLTSAPPLTKWLKCATMEGYTIVGLENNLTNSEMARQLILGQTQLQNGQQISLGEKVILILGEEVDGIAAEIRPLLDYFLEIPMCGQKESFNVSVATGIALWGLLNCY